MSNGIGDVNSSARGSGARYNDGKTRFDLIPMTALRSAADVFAYGTDKYAAWNWAKGMPWSVPYGCLMRHLEAWYRGEEVDPESGKSHLGHAMCNLIMLAHYEDFFREGDDRPPKELFRVGVSPETPDVLLTTKTPTLPSSVGLPALSDTAR